MHQEIMNTDEYINTLPEERKIAISKIREILRKNLPKGFEEQMSYGMIGFVVPHSLYPAGYHCDPKLPLPFIGLGSQKSHIGFYHMGIYANPNLLEWFTSAWKKHASKKLDMGKSCIRFKKVEEIPYDLIAELCTKMNPKEWIYIYEQEIKK